MSWPCNSFAAALRCLPICAVARKFDFKVRASLTVKVLYNFQRNPLYLPGLWGHRQLCLPLPSPPGLPPPCPWLRTPCQHPEPSVLALVTPQQGRALAKHSPAWPGCGLCQARPTHKPRAWPSLCLPHPQGGAPCPGLGLPPCPSGCPVPSLPAWASPTAPASPVQGSFWPAQCHGTAHSGLSSKAAHCLHDPHS